MIYYGILLAAVTMFSFQFLFKEYGNGLRAMLVFSAGSSLVGFIILFAINGFRFEFTWFSLFMAFFAALDSIGYTYFSLKALGRINLSLYSMFSMLGGMILPSVVGILFYNEELTIGKGICYALLMLALLLSSKKGGKKSGYVYYMGVFVLNGLAGVVSTFFQKANYPKTNAESFSIWSAIAAVIISFVALIILRGKGKKPSFKAISIAVVGGTLSRLANYVLVIALAVLPATVQYPFVTGGVMIASTIIAAIVGQKPSKREILAVAISFIGILALVFI